GILFVLGTSGATTLPQVIARNTLARNGMVVEVNIEESYFSNLLENKKNGIVVNDKSSIFLVELNTAIEGLLANHTL
ncbi:MAG: hypothetical protein ACPG49_12735, partial [Chitinophagales bacterium]